MQKACAGAAPVIASKKIANKFDFRVMSAFPRTNPPQQSNLEN
jgi:hypothetical protein